MPGGGATPTGLTRKLNIMSVENEIDYAITVSFVDNHGEPCRLTCSGLPAMVLLRMIAAGNAGVMAQDVPETSRLSDQIWALRCRRVPIMKSMRKSENRPHPRAAYALARPVRVL
jgi:hypothetical protein